MPKNVYDWSNIKKQLLYNLIFAFEKSLQKVIDKIDFRLVMKKNVKLTTCGIFYVVKNILFLFFEVIVKLLELARATQRFVREP